MLWVPGVDYVGPWREAAEAADALNAAAVEYGLEVRASPHAGARGEPMVWLRPEGARVIVRVLSEWGADRRAD
ncbi:hypothetical protein [Streptomyces sp. NPDC127108]|uniref:hypothetical protein n=1 Tax=Streptomyces sp. NPDC127108 TaxID=3345361 RepID=UPI00363246E8